MRAVVAIGPCCWWGPGIHSAFAQVGTTMDILAGVVTEEGSPDMLRLHRRLTVSVVTVNLLRGIDELA